MTAHETDDPPLSVPLVEEVAIVSKEKIVTGRVRISTHVDVIEDIARAALQTDTVEITRVPIDGVVDHVVQMRVEGDTTIIPVMEEVLIVETRLVLKEEIHIRRRTEQEMVEAPVTLRKQRAIIERIDEGSDDERS